MENSKIKITKEVNVSTRQQLIEYMKVSLLLVYIRYSRLKIEQ